MSLDKSQLLCPCCFQAYSKSILEGDNDGNNNASSETDQSSSPPPPGSSFSFVCGACAPSDIEKALAAKATNDKSVPPIVWLLTPQEIETKTKEILEATKTNLDAVASTETLSFDTVIQPLMTPPNYKTNPSLVACKFLQHCSTDPAIRKAASDAAKLFTGSRVQGRMRLDVYQKVKAYAEKVDMGEETLDDYQKHFVSAVVQDFERAGLALSEDDRQKLTGWLEEDSAICSEYGNNLGTDDTKLEFSKEGLKGCTDDFIQERWNEEKQACIITLKYPDIIPIGSNCQVGETRRKVVEAREGVGAYKNNLELVLKGITVRKKIANLLGYPSWAEYICTKRMSGCYQAVDDFLSDLEGKLQEAAKDDYDVLLKLKQEDEPDATKLDAWDTGFYNQKLLKTKYGVDSEKIREYFPLDHVVETTLAIYQELLGLTFVELPKGSFWSWHPEVRCFDVHDTKTEQRIGHFYLDLHPRPGKYGHAAIFHLVKHNVDHSAVDCMLCNLPASTKDKPSLLRHTNVVTFFHEFGHIMHGLCSEGIANQTRLAKCPRDFVEAPSQMLENWVWQPEILQRISKHYKTGESLPDDLLQSMVKAKHVNVAFSSLRQIYLSRLDLSIHGPNPPETMEALQALVDELRPKTTLVENPPGNNMLRTFGHLMNQYSASYYGYMWAEVLSADMFATRFEKEGIMNPKVGMEYRKYVLAPGGTHNITDHLTKFLGRPPNNEAFLKSRGILK